jgi:CRISPR-associated endonuclease/helicase Cas3
MVNRHRREILASCVAAASWSPGFFSLTVPTGGGKTLASLMLGLKHAFAYGMERVIIVVPYTSIIEQTAEVYRQVFREFGPATVIEHHSSFDSDNAPIAVRLATENWDGSIIITTAVQFFDSLFSNRRGQCRKLHRLAKSVVILDEAQTLPVGLLAPCLSVLRALVRGYQTSVVLCTATQPALNKRPDFLPGLKDVREIIPSPVQLYESMRRVRVSYAGPVSDNELVKRLTARKQVLCIVNTTRHAALLAAAIPDSFHLSGRMCPAHRLAVLAEIKQRLISGEVCRVISTPVIEAGVDIDFPCVYRAMAGLDQIAQAAGRCNREGLDEDGEVVVFEPEESFPPGHIYQSAAAARQVLPDHIADPLSLAAIDQFFRLHYWTRGNYDVNAVLPKLTKRGIAKIQFREAAEAFALIDTPTQSLIIPWGDEGASLCDRLRRADPLENAALLRYLSRKLQRYSINVWPIECQKLQANDRVELVHGEWWILRDLADYSAVSGLMRQDASGDVLQEIG